MPENFSAKLLAFCAGLISASFGAGITFSLWAEAHPTKQEIALELGCSAYNSTLEGCKAAIDAKRAREEVMSLREDVKDLRKDLSRGFGRCLVPNIYVRDEGGKSAVRLYSGELSRGVSPPEAFRTVVESDFP